MIKLTVILTTLFVFVAFLASAGGSSNSFVSYVETEINFLATNYFITLVVIIVFVVILTLSSASNNLTKRISMAVLKLMQIYFLSFFVAYILLFLIAFLQLNLISIIINTNPKIGGITLERRAVAKALSDTDLSPKILVAGRNRDSIIKQVANASVGQGNYYSTNAIGSIPNFLVLPTNVQNSGMVLVDNTLIIGSISPADLQTISPVVGYLLIKDYFGSKQVKSNPNIEVLSKNDFTKYRSADISNTMLKLDSQVRKIDSAIASLSAQIKNDTDELKNQEALSQADSIYKRCISVGYYRSGVFTRFYSDNYCNSLKTATNTSPSNIAVDWAGQLQNDQSLLMEYKYYRDFFKNQQRAVKESEGNIPRELGVFKPENIIKLEYYTKDATSVADYFEILTHEYLHYASFIKGKRLQDSLFEEGLTEYFARHVIKNELTVDTNLGYPVYVKIITQMAQTIPENELADIYFSKDEDSLEATLDKTFGDGFYENNQIIFESLQYASKPKEILQLANKIMKQIGGAALKEGDLYSSQTKI